MKKMFFCLVVIFTCVSLPTLAQEFITVKQVCPQCWGYGAVATFYGPARCPSCMGNGVIQLTYRNPYYIPSDVSFRGNASHYMRTGRTVHVICTTGTDKGSYYIYLNSGKEFIKFSNTWIRLYGGRFRYNGNDYTYKYN